MKKKRGLLRICLLLVAMFIMQTTNSTTVHAEEKYYWPTPTVLTLSRGYYEGHEAIDIATPVGTNIYATKSGTVIGVGNACTCQKNLGCEHRLYFNGDWEQGIGSGVIIKHDDGSGYSAYAHMTADSWPSTMTIGTKVVQGQFIGKTGQSGVATGPHLHFSLRDNSSTKRWECKEINNNKDVIDYVYSYSVIGAENDTSGIASAFPLVDGGIYKIRSVLSGKLIDIPAASNTNSTELVQWEENGTQWQQWKAVKHSDGYSFISVYNNKAMDMYMGYATAGTNLTIYDYNESDAQRFKLVDRGNGKYSIHPICSGLALDVYGYSLEDGGIIEQYAYHGDDNQLWTFETTDTEKPVLSNVKVVDVSAEGYTVTCDATDNVGITRVCFPTWSDTNGQDDLVSDWYNNTAIMNPTSGNTYSFRVNVADHNWEEGYYTTDIYAYDAAGNYVAYGVRVNVIRTFPLTGFQLNEAKVTLKLNETRNLYVTAYEPSNTTSDKTAFWSSANPSIATVDAYGNVIAKGIGSTTLTCNVAGVTRQCEVVVISDFPFTDVEGDSWYFSYVSEVYKKGYMVGSASTSFNPNGLLTRAESITTLYSVKGKPATNFVNRFSDVASEQWYSTPISWAYRNGIVSGYANGKFGISDLVTREQFALMLYQYAAAYNYNTNYDNNVLTGYSDVAAVSSWAQTAMKWAVSNEVINGKGGGFLDPKGNATRAECATMIVKLSQLQ